MNPFGLFWLAQAVSRFGDPITLIALATITYKETRSALFTALAVVIATLPNAAFGFISGAIADAVGPRRAMIASDLLRVLLVGAIAPLLTQGAPLVVAYALVFGAALCASVFNPARIALIPQLVPADRLAEANSRVGSTDRAVEIVGVLAAGFLVSILEANAFYVDAATFGVSALLLGRVRSGPAPRARLSVAGVFADAGAGLCFLFRSVALRANTVFALIAQLALPVVNGLTPVLLIRRFAAGDANLGAALFGVSEAALAAGALGAGITLPEYLGPYKKGRVVVVGFGIYGALLILLGLAPSLLPALVIFFCMGIANVMFLVPNITISQEYTPPEMRARVAAARTALLNLTWLPMFAVSGASADRFDAGLLIGLAGALTLATTFVGAFIPAVRDIP